MKTRLLLLLNLGFLQAVLAQTEPAPSPPKRMFADNFSVNLKTDQKRIWGDLYAVTDSVLWITPPVIVGRVRLERERVPFPVNINRIESGTVANVPTQHSVLITSMPHLVFKVRQPDPAAWHRFLRKMEAEAIAGEGSLGSRQLSKVQSISLPLPDSLNNDLSFGVSRLSASERATLFKGVDYHTIHLKIKRGPAFNYCLFALTDSSLVVADKSALRKYLVWKGAAPQFTEIHINDIEKLRILKTGRGLDFLLPTWNTSLINPFPFRDRDNTLALMRANRTPTPDWQMKLLPYSVLGQALQNK